MVVVEEAVVHHRPPHHYYSRRVRKRMVVPRRPMWKPLRRQRSPPPPLLPFWMRSAVLLLQKATPRRHQTTLPTPKKTTILLPWRMRRGHQGGRGTAARQEPMALYWTDLSIFTRVQRSRYISQGPLERRIPQGSAKKNNPTPRRRRGVTPTSPVGRRRAVRKNSRGSLSAGRTRMPLGILPFPTESRTRQDRMAHISPHLVLPRPPHEKNAPRPTWTTPTAF